MKIAGLDIGTTGCKLTVFDETGDYLDKAYRTYPVDRGSSEHEVDAEAIMDGVFAVIKEMAEKYSDIAGIGVTSFGETVVLTNEEGKPLHRAMLYTDPRGKVECAELEQRMEGHTIASITGVKPNETYSLPKLMWFKKHKPEIYAKAKRALLIEDFVVFRLTGNAQIDYSLAARTMGFDITNLCWSKEIFEMAGIDANLMSKPVPTGTSAGCISLAVSKATGLSEHAQIVSISHDQVAAAVGAGAFSSDVAADGAGTVQCVTPIYDELPDLDTMYDGNYGVVPYILPGKYVAYAYSYTGGALIQWCVETLAKKEQEIAKEKGISVNELLEGSFTEPTGLLVLPHFAGAGTPYMDSSSKGAILGLTTAHTVSDIYRACMESVVYEELLNVELLRKSGVHFEKMYATGGGAKSKVWMQMKADILNVPMVALCTVDAGTTGSAMLTGLAIGCYKDLDDAAAHMVEFKEVYEPDPGMHTKYMKIYERYKLLYNAVRSLI